LASSRPPLPGGFAIRPVDPTGDLEAVDDLVTVCDLADVGERDHQRSWIELAWTSEAVVGTWLVHDPDGRAAAYVELEAVVPGGSLDASLTIHPRHRDGPLRAALLAFVGERARELAIVPGSVLWVSGPSGEPGLAADVTAAGFAHVRVFWRMEWIVDRSYEPGEPPEGITIRPGVDPDDDRAIHAVLEEAFRGHFGLEPMTFERFLTEFKDGLYEASLTRLAEVDGQIVGVAVNHTPDGVGWVGDLGVLPVHRRRGIGGALLRSSFAALASRGVDRVLLNVDSQNETGATRLYEAVGMNVRRAFDIYERPV
jgi:ribosomal protein S18 acetylase RimI-like enzyme